MYLAIPIAMIAAKSSRMMIEYDLDFIKVALISLTLSIASNIARIDVALGSLAHHKYVESLPMLSSFSIAFDRVSETIPGYVLYNVTDKIKTLDTAAWFTRYLKHRDLGCVGSTIHIKRVSKALKPHHYLAFILNLGTPILFIILSYIQYIYDAQTSNYNALVSSAFMLGTVLCRIVNVWQLRTALDKQVRKALPDDARGQDYQGLSPTNTCKVWVTYSNSSVRVVAPRGLIRILLTDPKPIYPRFYEATRLLSLVMVAGQIVSLSKSSTTYMVYYLSVMLCSTALYLWFSRQHSNVDNICSKLEITVNRSTGRERHMQMFADMNMTEDEEESMRLWGLAPHASNEGWWEAYEKQKTEKHGF